MTYSILIQIQIVTEDDFPTRYQPTARVVETTAEQMPERTRESFEHAMGTLAKWVSR